MLTNDDFRKLLETPSLQQRPAAAATSAAPAAKGENDDNGEKKKRKFYKPKPKSAEKPVSVYRDRAAERRQEKDEDDNEGAPTLSAEQSKFLGGDVQYTHLVRGLDVALLEKTRAEQQALAAKKEILEAFGSDESDEGQGRGNAAANDDVDSLGKRLGALLEGDRVLLKNANTTRVAATLFAPGRMAYMFDLESEADKPTMNMRAVSAHATGTANRRSMASVPVPVIEDVANALAYGSGKKHKKRATATGGAAGGSASAGAATKTMPAGNNSQAGVITLSDVGSKKRAKDDEEKIFSDVSSSESEAEEGGDLKKPKIDEEKVKKGSYFAAAGAGSTAQTYDPLRSVLGVSAVKVKEENSENFCRLYKDFYYSGGSCSKGVGFEKTSRKEEIGRTARVEQGCS